MAGRFLGRLDDSPYFGSYERLTVPWRLAVGEVGVEPVAIILGPEANAWTPKSVVRLELADRRVELIADYLHCPWILQAASSVLVDNPS